MTSSNTLERFNAIPWPENVTELHAHLGGSVPLHRLWEIAVDRGIRGLGEDYEDFYQHIRISEDQVRDLDSYLKVYDTIELIQSGPTAVRESLIIAIHRAYLTGGFLGGGSPLIPASPRKSLFQIRNIELRLNPLKRTGAAFLKGEHNGLYDADRVIKSVCSAVEDIALAFNGKVRAGLIFCFGRDMSYDANMILAEKTAEWAQQKPQIIGIDLAGPESRNPLSERRQREDMKRIFDTVGTDIPRTIHAGETPHVDLDAFLGTVEALNPKRIAHPIIAFRSYWQNKDDRGLKILKERDITCELCVKSNLLTRTVSNIEEYGKIIQTLEEFEIPYTFSTDAPSLQDTSLAEELFLLFENNAINEEQILQALHTANEKTFLDKEVKSQ